MREREREMSGKKNMRGRYTGLHNAEQDRITRDADVVEKRIERGEGYVRATSDLGERKRKFDSELVIEKQKS